jgi:hypothetical protein
MKKKNFLWLSAIAGLMMFASASLIGCKDKDPGNSNIDEEDWDAVNPDSKLPDFIKNSTDFYIIYWAEGSYGALGNRVKEKALIRDIDVWEGSLKGKSADGLNSWGEPVEYLSMEVSSAAGNLGWNGGAIYTNLTQFAEDEYGSGYVPNLKAVTDNPSEYYFHFAIKSPTNQPDAGWVFFLYSDGSPTNSAGDGGIKLFVGPLYTVGTPTGTVKLGNYPHDGEWHHFDVPVSQLESGNLKYRWDGPMHVWTDEREGVIYLLGFQEPNNVVGTELNLDAVFFYKKAK